CHRCRWITPGGHMNRFNYSYSSDASVMAALRAAAIARGVAGGIVIGCIVAVATLTGCQQQPVSASRVLDAGVVQSTPSQESDASLDEQLRLDPSEIMFYSSNVHG
ncbi:MAG: hypothetical protein ABI580_11560, partial [Burkholderiaceae bacterium]